MILVTILATKDMGTTNGWISTLITVLGMIATVLITHLLAQRKNKAEAHKYDSESEVNNVALWKQLVDEYRKKMEEMTKELTEIRQELFKVKDREVEYLQNSISAMHLNQQLQKQITQVIREKEILKQRVDELEKENTNRE